MRARPATTTRLCQVAFAAFCAVQITGALVNPHPAGELNADLRFAVALPWAWLASAVGLFSRRALAWWFCLGFSTLCLFVALYVTFMNITGEFIEPSGTHWSLLEILLPPVALLVFSLHLRTRGEYFEIKADDQ